MTHTHAVVHNPDRNSADLLEREWLLTPGTGGFAMGTALGVNTRRYHGLLIAATTPPVGRVVVLNQLFEQLVLTRDGKTHTLEFGGCLFLGGSGYVIAPDCTAMLKRFDRGLDVAWSYQWGSLTLTRRLVLHDGEPACTVQYDITGLGAVCTSAQLRVRPMVTLRNFHSLEHRDDNRFSVAEQGDSLIVRRGTLSACYHAPGAKASALSDWWYGVHHKVEAHRGVDCFEDLFVPGSLEIDLGVRDDAHAAITATLGDKPAKPVRQPEARAKRLEPIRKKLTAAIASGTQADQSLTELPAILAQASDDFVVQRRVGDRTLSTIIAGYPWFADWGRDTFIALPGLLLCTGRHDEARNTLSVFAAAIKDGLVPNRFDDNDPTLAHYNTVDGSMWYVHGALEYLKATNDSASWEGWLAQACVKIIEAYRKGTYALAHDGQTKISIHMDSDGLIAAGNDQSQLTWMDAAAWGPDGCFHVFTPRPGKCVEINGLWHSALMRLADALPDRFKRERERYAALAKQVRESFTATFWSDHLGYLIDHVTPVGHSAIADYSLRPNQLIACALEHSPVHPIQRKQVISACRDRLLTPVGLRTLPTDDPAFHPRYAGGPFERDATYHRGMVWPWLMGPYCESLLRDGGFSSQAKREVLDTLSPLIARLTTSDYPGAMGSLHEIHEPLHPFNPRGCPAQAWSVAELLRILTMLGS